MPSRKNRKAHMVEDVTSHLLTLAMSARKNRRSSSSSYSLCCKPKALGYCPATHSMLLNQGRSYVKELRKRSCVKMGREAQAEKSAQICSTTLSRWRGSGLRSHGRSEQPRNCSKRVLPSLRPSLFILKQRNTIENRFVVSTLVRISHDHWR